MMRRILAMVIVSTACSVYVSTNSLLEFANSLDAIDAAHNPQVCNKTLTTGHLIDLIMHGYDKNMLPNPDGVRVTMELHIQEISSLSELTSDFELDVMYSEIWQDPACAFSNFSFCKTNVTLKPALKERIWTPDTCIVNSKRATTHASPSQNTFVILYQNGTVWINTRMLVKAPCHMDLKRFPFDVQTCALIIESYSYNSQEVQLNWFNPPVSIFDEGINLPDFDLADFKALKTQVPYPNGNWDQLRVIFVFSRRYGFYLLQAYFPTFLTVISSFLGLLLDTRSVSARITLGVSSLLALTFQFGTVLRHLPRVSYIKCLDVWMISSVSFVFWTLIELSIICQLNRREREKELGMQVIQQWVRLVRQRKHKPVTETETKLCHNGSLTAANSNNDQSNNWLTVEIQE